MTTVLLTSTEQVQSKITSDNGVKEIIPKPYESTYSDLSEQTSKTKLPRVIKNKSNFDSQPSSNAQVVFKKLLSTVN